MMDTHLFQQIYAIFRYLQRHFMPQSYFPVYQNDTIYASLQYMRKGENASFHVMLENFFMAS